MSPRTLVICLVNVVATGCVGDVMHGPEATDTPGPAGPGTLDPHGLPAGAGGSAGGPGNPTAPPPTGTVFFKTATRRLTRRELRQTVLDLTGVDLSDQVTNLPEDYAEAKDIFAFDNKYVFQQPSQSLIETAKSLAEVVGDRILSDAAVKKQLVSCAPGGASDTACLRTFVTTFGRRALRRPLATPEVDDLITRFQPFAREANDFYFAVSLIARTLLQDPEFLYRIEIGQEVAGTPGLAKLGGHEVASRLSYFLWGTAPDDALLDAAGTSDRLQTPDAVGKAAVRMLADARARAGVDRFHSMWFGYERQQPPQPLLRPMLDETNGLIERVVFKDRRPWLDLFRSKETYVDATLANHYGLPKPASGSAWTSYGTTGRQGILSHGTFLGVERKHDDTSPTMRGLFVRTRLMCETIPPPDPNLNVDVDAAGTNGRCKVDRYAMWNTPVCGACHARMDPIGLGLENYDRVGKYRTVTTQDAEAGNADCVIPGTGDLGAPGSSFRGVAELSDRLVDSKAIEACLSTQIASYYLGREVRDEERPLFQDQVAGHFRSSGYHFDQLLVDLVTLPGFGYRVSE
jgi:hypothetical protein